MILKNIRKRIALKNYENNKCQTSPKKLINGQGEYSHFRFGLCTLDRVGCGIIAFYNILRLLKESVKFEDLILEMETNRTETIPFGFFGINPFCMKKMFSSYGICFERFFSLSRLEKTREDGTIFLLTFWNDPKNWFRGAHTVAVRDRKTFFEVYNRNNQRKTVAKITDVSNICGNKALICGYRLWKEK